MALSSIEQERQAQRPEHAQKQQNTESSDPRQGPKYASAAAAAPVVDTASSLERIMMALSGRLVLPSTREWNTHNLAQRFAADASSAAAAGGLVAPLITMIDQAIMENASGRRPMMSSFFDSFRTLLLRPHVFLTARPFRLIFMLYSGTYLTANTLDTAKATVGNKSASTTTSGAAKFAATSAANLSLCLYKDSQFTRMFGAASSSVRPVPGASYALFAVRDALTVFASFNVPPLLAPVLPLSEEVQKHVSRATAAQFLAPAAMQLVSTPLHLLGLDLYNRPSGASGLRWRDRFHKVRANWICSSAARMCRIVPAFGLGGVVNSGARARLMRDLDK